ncbi:MAG TPA: papain-like cysteine protease family protein [Thermoanaerobaculia bacterium]|nr:papain-like cysteine protease family protein [Thermoanaerobaculia bacterium]
MPDGVPTVLRVQVAQQKRTNWCWAAVGLGIAQAYGTTGNPQQCDVAGRVLAPLTCCPYGVGCNDPHELPPALDALEPHFVAPAIDDPTHRTVAFIKAQIDDGHPVAVRIHRRHMGSGHFVVVSGYLESPRGDFLWVCDPETGDRKHWPITLFTTNYLQDGFWHVSYRTTGTRVDKEAPEAINDFVLE